MAQVIAPESDAEAVALLENRLATSARSDTPITYSQLVDGIVFRLVDGREHHIDVHDWTGFDRNLIGDYLGFISQRTYRDFGFMASSLTVDAALKRPSNTFFMLALRLGALKRDSAAARDPFWVTQLNLAREHYLKVPDDRLAINVPHWICIDKPEKKRIIHYAEGCHWSRSITQKGALGPLKPVGEMGPNGGWILFPTRVEAEGFAESEYPEYKAVKLCALCRPPAPIPLTPVSSDLDISPTERRSTHIYRLLRDTSLARWVKMKHDHCCQICGYRIELPDGSGYSEAHHIQPLGGDHKGPDIIQNIICVCPTHHAELDYFARSLDVSKMRLHPDHPIDPRFIRYHNSRREGS